MQRWFVSSAFAGVFSLVLAGVVSAQVEIQIRVQAAQAQAAQVQLQPGKMVAKPIMFQQPARLLQADAVFVGRVVAMEPMDIEAEPVKGQAKVTYRIATVEVTEAIHGLKKGTKMVRVAFIAQPNNNPGVGGGGGFGGGGGGIQILPPNAQPIGGGRRPFPGNINVAMTLQVGQDGMFTVNKHFKENFYLAPNVQNFVTRMNNQNFDAEVKTAKQLAKVMGDPVAALKSEDKQDRYLAAAILIGKYRTNPIGVATKAEPIDAAESKLILQALAGGDWTVGRFNASIPNPYELFRQLGINVALPPNQQQQAQVMQKWLDENNGKFVIQKLVADPNAKVAPPSSGPNPGVPPDVRPGVRPLPPRIQPLPEPKKD